MVVVDALHGDSAAAVADDLFGGGGDLQAFLDHAAPDVKPSGGDEGEEELEWLSNKDAFPTVETMAPSAPRPRWEVAWGPPQAPVAARAPAAGWRCRHCGTDRTPQWREGPEGRSTLCNACGVRYRSGRLLPEYRPVSSPTFSPVLHSNRHHRVVELRRLREGAANASLAAAGNGEKGNEKLERLSNNGGFRAVQVMAAAAARVSLAAAGNGEKGNEKLEWLLNKGEFLAAAPARPRTEGMRRPRKAEWTGIAWSPPPPRRTPAEGRQPSQGGGAGVAVEQGRVPDGDDDGLGGCAAVPADGGLNPAAPLAPSAAAGWRCQQRGTEKTPQWLEDPEGRTTLRFDGHNRVKLHRRQELLAKFPPATAEQLEWPSNMDAFPAVKATPPAGPRPQTKRVRRVVELSPPRAPPPPRRRGRRGGAAVAVEQGVVGDVGAPVVEGRATAAAGGGGDPAAARAATPRAPTVAGRQCRHCGTEKTPQWREGPEGRQTLCNACGVRYKSGRLVPEYRPASSPTFSPGLHSNSHRQVLQLRRRRKEPTEVSPASEAVAMACAAAAAVVGFCFD